MAVHAITKENMVMNIDVITGDIYILKFKLGLGNMVTIMPLFMVLMYKLLTKVPH